ncbi:MAG: phosphate acyltransferase PlsX [Desulfovibrio sp.]
MPSSQPCIAVDAMGGDIGPSVAVPAAVEAVNAGIKVILVGDEAHIHMELDKLKATDMGIEVVHASEVVNMDDKPADALRRKKDSSIQVACRLVKEGKADGVVSAGNSGATVACGMFILGRIKGVERPALAGVLPTEKEPCILMDVGANVDSKASHLAQFGIMADVMARNVLGRENPKVGLLSIGEEEGKGNIMVKEAYELLKKTNLRFIGNVEGRDIFTGDVDIVVCDGFVGNVTLKLAEGLAKSLGRILKGELKSDPISRVGAMLSLRAFKSFSQVIDYAEYGGAMLLGLRSVAIVCHGASNTKALFKAISAGAKYVETEANEHLIKELEAQNKLSQFRRASKGQASS